MPESVAALDQFSNIFNFPGGNSRSEFDAFRKSPGIDAGPPSGSGYWEHIEDFWKPHISFIWNDSFSLICTHCSPFKFCINRRSLTHEIPAQFLRIKSRRGSKKAIMAVAASMLTAAYHILRDDVDYKDLGGDYFNRTDRKKTADRLVKRLGDLGFTVEIKEAA